MAVINVYVETCPRCGTNQVQDLRTWKYLPAIERHICPICVFQGAESEDCISWLCTTQ